MNIPEAADRFEWRFRGALDAPRVPGSSATAEQCPTSTEKDRKPIRRHAQVPTGRESPRYFT
jgi:hypothetical protein